MSDKIPGMRKRELSKAAAELGKKGGKARVAKLSEEELRQQMKERGKAGAKKRWQKKKPGD